MAGRAGAWGVCLDLLCCAVVLGLCCPRRERVVYVRGGGFAPVGAPMVFVDTNGARCEVGGADASHAPAADAGGAGGAAAERPLLACRALEIERGG